MRKKGFLLALVLILSVVLMVMGFGYLGSIPRLVQSTYQAGYSAQARAIARAGLEDARVKLEKDPHFPPPGAADQRVFTYSEDFTDLDGSLLGSFEVQVDTRFMVSPYRIVRITSKGSAGPRNKPVGRSTVTATVNLSPTVPSALFRNLRWEDGGSY